MSNITPDDATAKAKRLAVAAGALPPDLEFSESYLARRMMKAAKPQQPVVYEFTTDPGLLHQYYRLREDMFISVWGLKNFSGAKEPCDDISEIMVARQGLQCIAGGRLTISSPYNPHVLPMEKDDFRLADLLPDLNLGRRTYGEFSRLAILPEFRAGNVFPEIARRFIRKAIAEGVEYAFNIAPVPLARNYRHAVQLFGVQWDIRTDVPVPDREEYEGIKMVLSVMDLTRFVRKPATVKPASELVSE